MVINFVRRLISDEIQRRKMCFEPKNIYHGWTIYLFRAVIKMLLIESNQIFEIQKNFFREKRFVAWFALYCSVVGVRLGFSTEIAVLKCLVLLSPEELPWPAPSVSLHLYPWFLPKSGFIAIACGRWAIHPWIHRPTCRFAWTVVGRSFRFHVRGLLPDGCVRCG